jgi:hypothetical protein
MRAESQTDIQIANADGARHGAHRSAVLFIWAGVLLGVAFVATPAKFLAPSLGLAQGLDVGRWTFHVLALIEWCLTIGMAGLLLLTGIKPASFRYMTWLCLGWVLAVLVAQTFGLRPVLDDRATEIIAGRPVPPNSLWHTLYVALETTKLALLTTAATLLMALPGK